MTDKLNPDEAWDTSRFQRDNVVDTRLPTSPPPDTHVLYTGPKRWQNLPPKSLYWSKEAGMWAGGDDQLCAIPAKGNLYAIPLNVSLPARGTSPVTPDILEEARDLIQGDRASSYGDAKTSFERIASLWSTYKGVEITAKDVASMMILLKVSRGVTSAKRDNWLDIIGYAALGSEIAQTQQPHRA